MSDLGMIRRLESECGRLENECEALRAEVERLRGAIRHVVQLADHGASHAHFTAAAVGLRRYLPEEPPR